MKGPTTVVFIAPEGISAVQTPLIRVGDAQLLPLPVNGRMLAFPDAKGPALVRALLNQEKVIVRINDEVSSRTFPIVPGDFRSAYAVGVKRCGWPEAQKADLEYAPPPEFIRRTDGSTRAEFGGPQGWLV